MVRDDESSATFADHPLAAHQRPFVLRWTSLSVGCGVKLVGTAGFHGDPPWWVTVIISTIAVVTAMSLVLITDLISRQYR